MCFHRFLKLFLISLVILFLGVGCNSINQELKPLQSSQDFYERQDPPDPDKGEPEFESNLQP